MDNVRIGFSDAFFGALTKLAPNVQAKVNQLVLKFQTNPKSPGLNYEKLNAVKDANMRSLRVDQAYRVILAAPDVGNVYLFLWVDHHDKAYDWAAKHQCRVNPNTGTLQLYASDSKPVEAEVEDTTATQVAGLFDALKERHLLKLGVPEEQVALVREIRDEQQLDALQETLPQEAYEGLFMVLAGENYDTIITERAVREEESFDTDNFAEALERIQSQARFVVPGSEEELAGMLNASMEKWRVFLHSSQRRLAQGIKNGPVRVLGGAGTGKTVVAMHRAKWLAEHIATEGNNVFFTTFTKNLAIDIQNNLATICAPEILASIEVVNLDRWVQGFLRKQSYDYELIYDESLLSRYWEQAISEKLASIDLPVTRARRVALVLYYGKPSAFIDT